MLQLDESIVKAIGSVLGGGAVVGAIVAFLNWLSARKQASASTEQSFNAVAFAEMRKTVDELRGEIAALKKELAESRRDVEGIRDDYEVRIKRYIQERDDARHEARNSEVASFAKDREIEKLKTRVADLERAVLDLGGELNGHARPSAPKTPPSTPQ